jgi:hypothetical protein
MPSTGLSAILLAATLLAQQAGENSGISSKETFSGWSLTDASKAAGYTLSMTGVDSDALAIMTAPATVPVGTEAALTARLTAGSLRNHPARFTAWLRISNPGQSRGARLSIETERPNAVNGPLDNLTSKAVTSADWTLTEVAIGVAADAMAVNFAVLAEAGAQVEIREEALNNVPLPIARMLSRGLSGERVEMPTVQLTTAAPAAPEAPARNFDLPPEPPTVTDLLPPELAEKQRIIQATARLAIQYVRNLPDFLCTETIRRADDGKQKGRKHKDVLSIRLGYSGGVEHYRLVAIDGKPSTMPVDSLTGGMTTGEFGSLLGQVFMPHTAAFDWDRWALLRGRTVSAFRYRVDLDKSKFHLKFEEGYSPAEDTISAYHGTVYIDKETNEVLRLVQIADPPAGFPLRQSTEIIDYAHVDVGGRAFLLPVQSESILASATLTSHNVIEFRDYQKFAAESKIEFE